MKLEASDEITFNVSILFGHVDIKSWFERDGNKLIGMSKKTEFDSSGQVVSTSINPTGVEVTFGS